MWVWLQFLEIIFYHCSCLVMVLVVRWAENLLLHSQMFSESEFQGLKCNAEMKCLLRLILCAYGALYWDANIFQTAWESCRAAGTCQPKGSKNLTLGMEEEQTIVIIKNRLTKVCKTIKNHCSSSVNFHSMRKEEHVYKLWLLPAGADPWLNHSQYK